MFVNHNHWPDYAIPEPTAGSVDAEPPLPAAADVLAFIQRALGPKAGRWLTAVVPFAHRVPALSGNILEVHFGKIENKVDFAARVNVVYDKGLIAGVKQGDYNLPFMPAGFALLLHQTESTFRHGVENIWVEYDAPFATAPALFFDINRAGLFDPQKAYDSLQGIAYELDYYVATPLLHFLKRIKEEGLYVIYYGLMFSRKTASVRLTINGSNSESLAGALRRLGWKGNYEALERFKSHYLHKGQKLVIGVDFGNRLEPRIGIEVFDDDPQLFVQKLYKEGYINSSQFAMLTSWERKLALSRPFATALTELHQRPVTELHARLNHFKFVLNDTDAIETKGYLYCCF